MRKGDGGPAFPVQVSFDENGEHEMQTSNSSVLRSGISIRDYFAAAALQGITATPLAQQALDMGFSHLENETAMAEQAYAYADAMIAAREGK